MLRPEREKQWRLHAMSLMFFLSLSLASASSAQRDGSTPCRRPPPKQYAAAAVVTIADTRSFPCTIAFHDLGVELRADPAQAESDIKQSVARDSRGRYYTSNGSGRVTVWSPTGKVLQNFGRLGAGPGEFARGTLFFSVDPADNLYIRDNQLRWLVFSPEYKLLRQERANGMGIRPESATFIAPMTMLSSELSPANASRVFGIFDFSGKAAGAGRGDIPPMVRAFGDVPASEQRRGNYARVRIVNAPVDGAFWAGPPEEAGRGYELQLIGLDGTVKRTIRRAVPWFKPGADLPLPMTHDDVAVDDSRAPIPKLPAAIFAARYDGHGLIYVGARMTSNRWKEGMIPTGDREQRSQMFFASLDFYYEVIDVDAGVVLASSGPMAGDCARREMPLGWFGSGWSGYRLAENSDGLPIVKMLEVRLNGH